VGGGLLWLISWGIRAAVGVSLLWSVVFGFSFLYFGLARDSLGLQIIGGVHMLMLCGPVWLFLSIVDE
jgi:hypothetical protein